MKISERQLQMLWIHFVTTLRDQVGAIFQDKRIEIYRLIVNQQSGEPTIGNNTEIITEDDRAIAI